MKGEALKKVLNKARAEMKEKKRMGKSRYNEHEEGEYAKLRVKK